MKQPYRRPKASERRSFLEMRVGTARRQIALMVLSRPFNKLQPREKNLILKADKCLRHVQWHIEKRKELNKPVTSYL